MQSQSYQELVSDAWNESEGLEKAIAQGVKNLDTHHKNRILSIDSTDLRELSALGWQLGDDYSYGMDQLLSLALNPLFSAIDNGSGVLLGVGGTGRRDCALRSDVDPLYIAKEPLTGEHAEIVSMSSRMLVNLGEKSEAMMGTAELSDLSMLDAETWNALADYRIIKGEPSLNAEVEATIQDTYNPRKRAIYLLSKWEKQQANPLSLDAVEGFNIKDSAGGLRNIQNAIWFENLQRIKPPHESIGKIPKKLYDSMGILHVARNFLHATRPDKNFKSSNTFAKEDFVAMRNHFGDDFIGEVQYARRAIRCYSFAVIYKQQKRGIRLSDDLTYVHGKGGLRVDDVGEDSIKELLLESQRHGLEIDYGFAHEDMSDFTPNGPYFEIFSNRGDQGKSLHRMRLFGMLNNFIPGFKRLEQTIGSHSTYTKSGEAFERLHRLHEFSEQEDYDKWDDNWKKRNHETKIALPLLLFTENLKETELESFFEKHSVSQAITEKYDWLKTQSKKLRTLLRDQHSHTGVVETVKNMCENTGDLETLVAHASAHGICLQPELQGNLWEIYAKITEGEVNIQSPEYLEAYYGENGPKIGRALPVQFRTSQYKHDTDTALKALMRAYESDQPQVSVFSSEENRITYRIVSPDYRGLISDVTGTTHAAGKQLRQFHTFTLFDEDKPLDLALDYLTIQDPPKGFEAKLEEALRTKNHEHADVNVILSQMKSYELDDSLANKNKYTIKARSDEKVIGAVYGLSEKLQETDANIFNVTVYTIPHSGAERYTVHFETPKPSHEVKEFVASLPKIT